MLNTDETFLLARIETLEADLARKKDTPKLSLPTRRAIATAVTTSAVTLGLIGSIAVCWSTYIAIPWVVLFWAVANTVNAVVMADVWK